MLAKADPIRRQVLRVKGTFAGSKVASTLEQGDMLVAVDGRPVTCFADVEEACWRMAAQGPPAAAGALEGAEGGASGVPGAEGEAVSDVHLTLTIFRQVSPALQPFGPRKPCAAL